jgi:hypothetical protein
MPTETKERLENKANKTLFLPKTANVQFFLFIYLTSSCPCRVKFSRQELSHSTFRASTLQQVRWKSMAGWLGKDRAAAR